MQNAFSAIHKYDTVDGMESVFPSWICVKQQNKKERLKRSKHAAKADEWRDYDDKSDYAWL